ncbi:hypothetical protein [Photorhabdus sp. SF281]|uniref:hypothetical protein n=1 Tax=Photorhabdus sp. SF281 TaxID=3459527 RepID=UPI0040449BF6
MHNEIKNKIYTANIDINDACTILAAEPAVLARGGTMQLGRPLKREPNIYCLMVISQSAIA